MQSFRCTGLFSLAIDEALHLLWIPFSLHLNGRDGIADGGKVLWRKLHLRAA